MNLGENIRQPVQVTDHDSYDNKFCTCTGSSVWAVRCRGLGSSPGPAATPPCITWNRAGAVSGLRQEAPHPSNDLDTVMRSHYGGKNDFHPPDIVNNI